MDSNIVTTAEQLKRWAASAAPGETCCYHHGRLAIDRLQIVDRHQQPVEPIDSVGSAALDLYDRGLVDLIQRRNSSSWFYLAQRRSGPVTQRKATLASTSSSLRTSSWEPK